MASQSLRHCWPRLGQSILGFHKVRCRADCFSVKSFKLPSNVHFSPISFRTKNASRLLLSKRCLTVHASNNPSGGSLPENPKETKADAVSPANGPPLLTILAGFVVLFIVFSIVKSIVLWLIRLIFTFPSSK